MTFADVYLGFPTLPATRPRPALFMRHTLWCVRWTDRRGRAHVRTYPTWARAALAARNLYAYHYEPLH